MTALYAVQGMSEAPFIFFFVASIYTFLRWCETRRTVLLPLAGVLVGADCLCRNEALVIALLMGIGVIVQSIRDRGNWRQVETQALLFGLPALFVLMLWLGSAAIIFHDPLYVLHANGVIAQAPAAGVAPSAGGGPSSAARANAYGSLRSRRSRTRPHQSSPLRWRCVRPSSPSSRCWARACWCGAAAWPR